MSDGLAVLCDAAGGIQRVLLDTIGVTAASHPPSKLAEILVPGHAGRATEMMNAAAAQGAVFGWELSVTAPGSPTLEFSAVRLDSGVLVVGNARHIDVLRMVEDLTRMNASLVDTVRQLRQGESGHPLPAQDLEGLTRLNTEMASLQRRLLRRIAELETLQHRSHADRPGGTPDPQAQPATSVRRATDDPDATRAMRRSGPSPAGPSDGDAERVLEAALRSRDNFLAAMSHEFFTPLNSVIGYSHMLLMQVTGPLNDAQLTHVELIKEAGEYLQQVALDVLDLTRLRSGAFVPDTSVFDLRDIAPGVLRAAGLAAREAGVALETEVDDEELFVDTDERRVMQAVTRLVGNAVKFTAPGGSVTLAIRRSGDSAEVSVTDTGVGIPLEQRTEVFEPFAKVQADDGRVTEGPGVGLAIVDHVLALLDIQLRLESTLESGSRFWFRIPLIRRGADSA